MSVPAADPARFAALGNGVFLTYWLSRLASGFAMQIQTVAVGWQVYDLTRNPLDLGLVGLSQFLPALLLVLVTGSVADRYRRRTIMAVCLGAEALCAAALLTFALRGMTQVWMVFAILAAFGTARAFYGPAQQSLLPNLVPTAILSNAIALNSMGWQIATIVGPVAGGLLYGLSPQAAYGVAVALLLISGALILMIPRPGQKIAAQPATWETIIAGFRYIRDEKIVLGAISLDLFAVLLGGATALLPVYARDILDVGPWGLGLLRAGPGDRRHRRGALSRHPSDPQPRRPIDVPVRRRLRDRHGGLRPVHVGVGLCSGPRRHGRRRHGQHLRARDAHPTLDARPGPRPGQRRQHGVRRRLQRARRVPRRHLRRADRHGAGSRGRRARHGGRRRPVVPLVPRAAGAPAT